MSFLTDFDIRFSEMSDLAFLEKWFSDDEELKFFPFGIDEKEMALKNWIGFSRYKASLTGLWQEEVVAVGTLFLMPYRKVAHHASFYLIVDPKHRRKGIGTSMVKNLLHLAKTKFKLESLHVEVYEPSPLIPLVLKLGFVPFARQENFIHIDGKPHARLLLEHFF